MGLFDWGSSDDYANSQQSTQNAANSNNQYYGYAQNSLSPYTSNASQDFNYARQGTYNQMSQMQQAGNPNAPFYKTLQMTPSQLLGQAESGYSMDPATQQKMKYSESAAQNALNANGMYGSGAGDLEMAEIGSTVYSQGEQQYLSNLMDTFDKQLQVLGIDDNQRASVMNEFGKEIGLESKASSQMGNIAQRTGESNSRAYQNQSRLDEQQAKSDSNKQPLANILSLAGAGMGLYGGMHGSSHGSSWSDPNTGHLWSY